MATYAEFGEKTDASEVLKVFGNEIKGKTVLITGVAVDGIGGETALAIASQNPALLILASRTVSKIAAVISTIKASYPSVSTRALAIDLSSPTSVRHAAAEVLSYPEPTIDILINNAGIMDLRPTRTLTAEGLEQHFATNHIGHFLFTNLILPKITAAASKTGDARIVILSSGAAPISPFRFHDVNVEKSSEEIPEEERPNLGFLNALGISTEGIYLPIVAYAQSKTANILFGTSLSEGLKAKGVTVLVIDPGQIRTALQRTTKDEDLGAAAAFYWKTLSQGASTTLVAAFDPIFHKKIGIYLNNCQVAQAPPFATDIEIAKKLWRLSEKTVAEDFQI